MLAVLWKSCITLWSENAFDSETLTASSAKMLYKQGRTNIKQNEYLEKKKFQDHTSVFCETTYNLSLVENEHTKRCLFI